MNAYSYSKNNPINFSDPTGLWYGELSYTAQTGPLAGSYGLRFDGGGVDWFYGAGGGAGLFGGFGVGISSGVLPHKPELSVSRNASAAFGGGLNVSREGTFNPAAPLSNGTNPSITVSMVAGMGGGVSQNYTRSGPLVTFGGNTTTSASPLMYTNGGSRTSVAAPGANMQSTLSQLASALIQLRQVLSTMR
jgi:hypothetical protein